MQTASALLSRLVTPLAAAALAMLTACNNCERLVEKVCSDLGEDCALWREIGGPDAIIPGGRKVESACGQMASNEAAYEGIVNSARGLVLAERLTRAAEKGDKAEMEKVKGLLDENKKRIEEGLAKLNK